MTRVCSVGFGEDRDAALVGVFIELAGLLGVAYLAQYDAEQAARVESLGVVGAGRNPPSAHRFLGKFPAARVVPSLEQETNLVNDQAPGVRAVLIENRGEAEVLVDAGQEVPVARIVWSARVRGDEQPADKTHHFCLAFLAEPLPEHSLDQPVLGNCLIAWIHLEQRVLADFPDRGVEVFLLTEDTISRSGGRSLARWKAQSRR